MLHLLLLLGVLSPYFSTSSFAQDSECLTALVEDLEGVVVKSKQGGTEHTLKIGDLLESRETIHTKESWVDLRFCDGSALRIGENSEFIFQRVNLVEKIFWSFQQIRGSLRGLIQKDKSIDYVKFRIVTPTASVGVRGTEFFVDVNEKETSLYTVNGEVLFGTVEEADELLEPITSRTLIRFQRVGESRTSKMTLGARKAPIPKKFFARTLKEHKLFREQMEYLRESYQDRVKSIKKNGGARKIRKLLKEKKQKPLTKKLQQKNRGAALQPIKAEINKKAARNKQSARKEGRRKGHTK